MILPKKIFIAGVSAVIIGVFGTLPTLYYTQNSHVSADTTANVTTEVTAPPETITGKPVRIIVPDRGIDLAVADGVYNPSTREWTLSNNKAHFAVQTVQPNNSQGNTFIYGHALSNVFGNLTGVQTGSMASVFTDNGYEFKYRFVSSVAVKPTDITVFDYKGAPNLTLQTCSGAWYQNRQMFDFDFVEVVKL